MDDIITPEEYFRDHAQKLRAFARYTSPKASARLIEAAQFLEMQADRARDRSVDDAKRRNARRYPNGSDLPRLRRD
jgi:hypothetical protein